MNMNVYWIDSYQEYDPELVESVMNLFKNSYQPLLNELNLNFQVIDIKALKFDDNHIIYDGKNILAEKAIAYINCTNPSIETEKLQKRLYDIAIKSKILSVLNYVSQSPLVDKNKLTIINLADELGIPTIPTIDLQNQKAIQKLTSEISNQFGYPVIIKPIDMFGGIAVHMVNNAEQLISILEIISFSQRNFIAQKKFQIKSDCRLYIADFKFIACLKRTPKDSSSLGNIAKGATASVFLPPQSVIESSIKIARKIKASFLCVDWFEIENGDFVFSEIETAGGFVQLSPNERLQVARKLFRWKAND
ncbi:MAG: ATP-grasp domain-containing protein [Bdellovibrio sp.]